MIMPSKNVRIVASRSKYNIANVLKQKEFFVPVIARRNGKSVQALMSAVQYVENLEVVTRSEYAKLHARLRREL